MKGKRLLFNLSFSACIVLLVLILPISALAVITFERTYDGGKGDFGYSAQQTLDGGYIVAGYTYSFGAGWTDFYLVRTDSLGNVLWDRTYGGSDVEIGYSVQQTHDGGYIVAGYTESFGVGASDVYLVKTDSLGNTLWTRTYGGSDYDGGYSVQRTLDRGYIIAGSTKSYGAGRSDFYVIKTDSLGNILWEKTYGGSDVEISYSVQQTVDGGYVIAGETESFGAGNSDVYLLKTDSLGDTLWTRTYGGVSSENSWSVQQTLDRGYIIAGWTSSFGAGFLDVYLVKADSLGDILWTRTYGGIEGDEGRAVQQTSDGGYVIAGHTESFGVGFYDDIYLIKTDSRGLVGVCDPICLKQNVIAELDTLKPQSKGLAKKIKKAKKHIEKSLEPKRWLDDTHLHHKHGNKVFHEEKKAVNEIKKLCKKGEFPGELCERLIGMLLEADSILARVAIDDAVAAGGKEKEIEKAEKEMAKAEKDKENEKYDKAIDHYKHAWQHAQKAMKKRENKQ